MTGNTLALPAGDYAHLVIQAVLADIAERDQQIARLAHERDELSRLYEHTAVDAAIRRQMLQAALCGYHLEHLRRVAVETTLRSLREELRRYTAVAVLGRAA